MNLAQAIASRAAAWAGAPALSLQRKGFSYEQLDDAAGRLAALLRSRGVAPGGVVALGMPSTPLHLLAILALARLGAVSLSLPAGMPAPQRRDLARFHGATHVVCAHADLAVEGVPTILVDRGWERARSQPVDPVPVPPEAPWRIALSSGTTGMPKGVLLTHGQTLEFLDLYPTLLPASGRDTRVLAPRGMETGFGLRSCLRHLLKGGAVVFAPGLKPADMAETMRKSCITHAMASPPLLRSLAAALPPGGPHFPGLVHLAVGGTRLAPEIARLARERITPHLYSHYGASEAGMIAVADPALLERDSACAGRLVSWLEAQALDEQRRPLPAGTVGLLRFRGPGVAQRYHGDPEATARHFGDGWFQPGDTGRITAEGLLYLEGRIDDLVNVGGEKIDPAIVERTLESHPEVAEAAVFGVRSPEGRDQLCAAVVVRGRVAASVLIQHCQATLGARRSPVRLFAVRELPRNENGKVLRRECQRRAERKLAARRATP